MVVPLYMDHHVPRAITDALRQRNLDVVTAFEDNAHELPDVELLDRAVTLGRVLFARDTDFLAEAGRRHENGIFFRSVEFSHRRLPGLQKVAERPSGQRRQKSASWPRVNGFYLTALYLHFNLQEELAPGS